jgi:hypothetical protein
MSDSTYHASYNWYVRIRFTPSANTVYYTLTTYALNGEIEFTNSQSHYVYNNNFRTSGVLPTYFEPFEKRYTKFYYELENTKK